MSAGWAARAATLDGPRTRGQRFLARHSGAPVPRVADLTATPVWPGWAPSEQRRLSLVAALLHHRRQVDRELRSEILAPLVAAIGEDCFDRLCALPFTGQAQADVLPGPARLHESGMALLDAARSADRPSYEGELTRTATALLERAAA